MNWLCSILVAVGKRLVPSMIVWYFTQARGEAHRESDRLKWWRFNQRAETTKTKADDALSVYLKARCNFHDSPEAKANRKLIEMSQADLEMVHGKFSGPHQP